MRILFAGTPHFAQEHLQALLQDSRFDVVGVYTQPDRPAGRGKRSQASAVKQLALEHGIPVEQPVNFKNDEAIETLRTYQADIMVVVAYGLLLPKAVLDAPRLGCINVHGSILPRWRGAAPIQRAIWAQDNTTGISIMQMDEGLDTGPTYLMEEISIEPQDTSASLYNKLAILGPTALITVLAQLQSGKLTLASALVQDDALATYAQKITKEEALIDWSLNAAVIDAHLRAFTPWPGSEFYIEQTRIKVTRAKLLSKESISDTQPGTVLQASKDGIDIQCGQGVLRLLELQPAGRKALSCQDLLNSRKHWFIEGQLIGSQGV